MRVSTKVCKVCKGVSVCEGGGGGGGGRVAVHRSSTRIMNTARHKPWEP